MTQTELILLKNFTPTSRLSSLNLGDRDSLGETFFLHRTQFFLLKLVNTLKVSDVGRLRPYFLHLLIDNVIEKFFHFFVFLLGELLGAPADIVFDLVKFRVRKDRIEHFGGRRWYQV